jgi:hypothetical protein
MNCSIVGWDMAEVPLTRLPHTHKHQPPLTRVPSAFLRLNPRNPERQQYLQQQDAAIDSCSRYTMENAQTAPAPGSLSWKLSSHPITLLTFLFFRICMHLLSHMRAETNISVASLLVYLFGLQLLTSN